MRSRSWRNRTFGNIPDFFHFRPVFWNSNFSVTRKNMRQHSLFTNSAACVWLTCKRDGSRARLANFTCQEMEVITQIVSPCTPFALIKTHSPHCYSAFGVAKKSCGLDNFFFFHSYLFRNIFRFIIFKECFEFIEI